MAQVMYLFTRLVPGLCLFLCDCVLFVAFLPGFLLEVSSRVPINEVLRMYENNFPSLFTTVSSGAYLHTAGATAAGRINVTH